MPRQKVLFVMLGSVEDKSQAIKAVHSLAADSRQLSATIWFIKTALDADLVCEDLVTYGCKQPILVTELSDAFSQSGLPDEIADWIEATMNPPTVQPRN
jgi:hypothetical protein